MPHKDPEARKVYARARWARLKEEKPEVIAKKAAYAAEYHQKKYREDEAYKARRKADYEKWYAEFGKERAREREGYRPMEVYLAECEERRRKSAAYMREWSQTDSGQRSRVAQSIKKRCGLTIEDYDRIYDEQGGKCRICGTERERYTRDRLVVDHCHTTGKFRALLCGSCNSAIGLLGENEDTLQRAIDYLREVCKKE